MTRTFDFESLVELCRRTHEEMQGRAARAVDTSLVVRNWLFGWYIVEYEQDGADRAVYGKQVIQELSRALKANGMRGVSTTNIKQFRSFFLSYRSIGQTASDQLQPPSAGPSETPQTASAVSDRSITEIASQILENRQTVSVELLNRFTLGWSHYVTLLTIDDSDERRFYEIEAAQNQWSVRELERQLASSLYERLALSRDKEEVRRLAQDGQIVEKAADLVKDPLVLEFLGLEEKPAYTEHELESAIIDRLQVFLLELGKGFLFEARQKRFTFDNDHFYIDLVFYNRLLRCYVLIDLKRDKLTHQDLGQMQMYVNYTGRTRKCGRRSCRRVAGGSTRLARAATSGTALCRHSRTRPVYFDRHVKADDELPTIGIVLCHRKNDALVELTLPADANIFAPRYQLYVPSKEELKRQLERIQAELGGAR